jgi:hypothetical protein
VEVTQVIKPWQLEGYSDGVKNTVKKSRAEKQLHQLAAHSGISYGQIKIAT